MLINQAFCIAARWKKMRVIFSLLLSNLYMQVVELFEWWDLALYRKMEAAVITVPWWLRLGEWMPWVLPHKTTMILGQTALHSEVSNFSHKYNIQMYFSFIALRLFYSQIVIISEMLFLNWTLSYHKYRQKVSNPYNDIFMNSLFSLLRNLHLHN